ncbi:tetratricopeptide repeat protein [Roseomonas genomospecies 6]|nr:tetratricopeptide repeat protein [Roseomonas genomospecies 6]
MAGQTHTARSHAPLPIDADRWRRAIREDTFSNYHYEMGLALRQQGESAAAVAAFQRALAIKPDLATASVALIETLEETGRSKEARVVRHAAAVHDPDFEIAADLVRIEDAAGQESNDLSPATVAAVHSRLPHLVRPLVVAAHAFRNAGRYDEAAEWSAKALSLNTEEAIRSELDFLMASGSDNTVQHLADRMHITTDSDPGKPVAHFFFGRPAADETGLLTTTIWLRVLHGCITLTIGARGSGERLVRITALQSAEVVPVDVPVLIDADFRQIEIFNSNANGTSEFEVHGVLVRKTALPSVAAATPEDGTPGDDAAAPWQPLMLAETALRMAGRHAQARHYTAAVPAAARFAAARNNLRQFTPTLYGSLEDAGGHRLLRAREGDFVYAAFAGLGQPESLPCSVRITVFLRVLKGLGGVCVTPATRPTRLTDIVPVKPAEDIVAVTLGVEAGANFGHLVILASAPGHPSEPPAEIELYGFLVE